MIQFRAARPADAAAIAGMHADADLPSPEFVKAGEYDSYLAWWKKLLIHAPQGVFLAEDDALGHMGFVHCGASRQPVQSEAGNFRGEIFALVVRPVCQGMGLGQQLLEAAIGNLRKAGYSAVMACIQAENANRKFLERMGGQSIDERMMRLDEKEIAEIIYGWGGKLPAPPKRP